MMGKFSRWPMLMAAGFLVATAVGIDLSTTTAGYVVTVLIVLGAVCLGGFVYAEGARHREWLGHLFDSSTGGNDQEGPGPLPDTKE